MQIQSSVAVVLCVLLPPSLGEEGQLRWPGVLWLPRCLWGGGDGEQEAEQSVAGERQPGLLVAPGPDPGVPEEEERRKMAADSAPSSACEAGSEGGESMKGLWVEEKQGGLWLFGRGRAQF